MSTSYTPPYSITEPITNLIVEIGESVGSLMAWQHMEKNPRLRRDNRIRTIHASLAIENNSLSLDQVTDIINGKRVLGELSEIREVKNAYEAYDQLLGFNPYSIEDLLRAHQILMADLVKEAGKFRAGGVGIFKGQQIVHMAPPAETVYGHVSNLLDWLRSSKEHPLIKSCVFHYEFEFIHPFSDGNGRMGRMWNTLLLYQWKPIFAWIPVESIIRERQAEYYDALGQADSQAEATPFVEFLLRAILDTLKSFEQYPAASTDSSMPPHIRLFLETLGNEELSVTELMHRLGLTSRASFRKTYLQPCLKEHLIEMTLPDTPKSRYQKYRVIKKNSK
jgi:Fic family protein